jgi:hypothetical protein
MELKMPFQKIFPDINIARLDKASLHTIHKFKYMKIGLYLAIHMKKCAKIDAEKSPKNSIFYVTFVPQNCADQHSA